MLTTDLDIRKINTFFEQITGSTQPSSQAADDTAALMVHQPFDELSSKITQVGHLLSLMVNQNILHSCRGHPWKSSPQVLHYYMFSHILFDKGYSTVHFASLYCISFVHTIGSPYGTVVFFGDFISPSQIILSMRRFEPSTPWEWSRAYYLQFSEKVFQEATSSWSERKRTRAKRPPRVELCLETRLETRDRYTERDSRSLARSLCVCRYL